MVSAGGALTPPPSARQAPQHPRLPRPPPPGTACAGELAAAQGPHAPGRSMGRNLPEAATAPHAPLRAGMYRRPPPAAPLPPPGGRSSWRLSGLCSRAACWVHGWQRAARQLVQSIVCTCSTADMHAGSHAVPMHVHVAGMAHLGGAHAGLRACMHARRCVPACLWQEWHGWAWDHHDDVKCAGRRGAGLPPMWVVVRGWARAWWRLAPLCRPRLASTQCGH